MSWRISQSQARERYLAQCKAAEAAQFDALLGHVTVQVEEAYLASLMQVIAFRPGMMVLDAGAGTGAFTQMLTHFPGLLITALEPAPTMLAILRKNARLHGISMVQGFCDGPNDRDLFATECFDVILSRQLTNSLYDPLQAFRHWHYWLKPEGKVVVIDGLYQRSDWTGPWLENIDQLPLATHQSLAIVPYLLEQAQFRIETVQLMHCVNHLPSTKTPKYIVVAQKVGA